MLTLKTRDLSLYFEASSPETFVAEVAAKAKAFKALTGVEPEIVVAGGCFVATGRGTTFLRSHGDDSVKVTSIGRGFFFGIIKGQTCRFRPWKREADSYCCLLKLPPR